MKYSRDIDELRMDAQDMMEETEYYRDMDEWGLETPCQHGISQFRYCEDCEKEWIRAQELHEGGDF